LEQVKKNKSVKGVKLEIAGRLDGSEMSRREWLSSGTIPLHTLRADVDFARATARTTYGAIGVKVWVHKGEVFQDN
jgi:small subunit ribosomal protein S3